MKGSKQEVRPGVWRLRVYIGRDHRGRLLQASRTVHGGSRQADTELRRLIKEVERSRTPQRNATVGQLLDEWLAHRDAKPSTQDGDRSYIEHRIKPVLGELRLERLTARHLDSAYREWLKEGLRPATVYKMHSILSSALRQAVKWEWVDEAVSDRASPPRPDGRLTRAMSQEDVVALINEARDGRMVRYGSWVFRWPDWLRMAITLGVTTGARRGEMCALRWSDLSGNNLVIARSASGIAKRGIVHGSTKTHQVRTLALDETTLAMMEQWRREQRELAERAAVPLDADPFYLSSEPRAHVPVHPSTLSQRFSQLCRHLGMPYHLHELRHYAATTMIVGGIDARTTATRLGHARPDITLKTYAHAVAAADQAAADLLGGAIRALNPTGNDPLPVLRPSKGCAVSVDSPDEE